MTLPSSILFDFDGTIVDSMPALQRVYETFVGERECKGALPAFSRVAGMPIPKCLEELKMIAGWSDSLTDLVHAYESAAQAAVLSAEPCPGALEFLRDTKAAGIQRAIVSSARDKLIVDWLRSKDSLDLIDIVVGRDSTGHCKPHPEPYLLGMRSLRCGPMECIAVEDSIGGVQSARRAGIVTYFIGAGDAPLGAISLSGFRQLSVELGIS